MDALAKCHTAGQPDTPMALIDNLQRHLLQSVPLVT